jgi:hypothetical protein
MDTVYRYARTAMAFFTPFCVMFLAHYVAANVYVMTCANLSLYGLFLSVLTTSSPICGALLSVITHTQTSYAMIVSGLVGVALQKLVFPI